MKANYHTHTARCGHATGTDREYVEAAVRAGYDSLGFSDHAPMPFKTPGFVSRHRMPLDGRFDYVRSLLALREEFMGRIDLRIGFEAEFYPDVFPDFLARIADIPIDFLLLGQHYLGNEEEHRASVYPTEREEDLRLYCDTVERGVDTGVFSYVAHPDMLHFVGDPSVYRRLILPWLARLKGTGLPLEINRLGMQDGRHYPNPAFWEMVAEIGNPTIVGMDAHQPEVFLDEEARARCFAFANRFGLTPLDTPALRVPRFPNP